MLSICRPDCVQLSADGPDWMSAHALVVIHPAGWPEEYLTLHYSAAVVSTAHNLQKEDFLQYLLSYLPMPDAWRAAAPVPLTTVLHQHAGPDSAVTRLQSAGYDTAVLRPVSSTTDVQGGHGRRLSILIREPSPLQVLTGCHEGVRMAVEMIDAATGSRAQGGTELSTANSSDRLHVKVCVMQYDMGLVPPPATTPASGMSRGGDQGVYTHALALHAQVHQPTGTVYSTTGGVQGCVEHGGWENVILKAPIGSHAFAVVALDARTGR